MPSSVASPSKDRWRTRFRAYRRGLAPATYRARSTLICARTAALPAVARAGCVHLYWPLAEKGEVDTRPLIQTARGRGTTVVLPVVTSFDPAAPTMAHRRYEGPGALSTNRWGIREPVGTAPVPPDAPDAVVVPALGADPRGTRLGQGAGYYDTFLRDLAVPRIVLTYEACVVDTLPAEPHDVPATTVVTERRVIGTGAP
ncbi:MAG: 5-formyltetrahydrofolate cyclo-ligase [Salinibacter sp.]